MWTQTLSLSPYAHRHSNVIDLGVEPAIEVDGERHTFFDHRRVSVRWLCGTIAVGLMGAALIGATIFSALDHESNYAEAPLPARPVTKEAAETGLNPRKGDRLVKPIDIVAAKQEYRVATPTKSGDKEVMRMHTFDRVETTLLTATAGFADEVPPYNPLKVLADARAPVEVVPEQVQDDPEFSWTTRDFSPQTLTTNVSLSMDEVQAQVADHVKTSLTAASGAFGLQSQLLLMRTSRAEDALPYANARDGIGSSPFSSIEVRMVPENVTVIPRAPTPPQRDEKLVTIRHGDSFENTLLNAGVKRDTILTIDRLLATPNSGPAVPDGRRVKLLFTSADAPEGRVLGRMSVYADETLETTIALRDDGSYMRLSSAESPDRPAVRRNDDDNPNAMPLYNSLYETGLKQEIPKPIIDDLVRIFANDVDFQRGVSGGDTFEAFYDRGDEGDGNDQLLFASITARGETYRYYRFQTPDDGTVDYYDQNGKSTRKFLVRAPILNFKITSGFGSRFHPILGYTRPHTGVDFAAPIGTPIFAAGNGTIAQAGWSSGYGRRIEIQHANGYVTTYNHLSGFARGIAQGTRVRQGQVVGYLGQTGLATGPHLHYEVLVNGHFVDPMKVKLARTREFDGRMLGAFTKERERIDDLLAKAPSAQAQVTAQK